MPKQRYVHLSFSHFFFNLLNSVHMMKNRGPSTDPSSPNPSSICWLQTQCIWWRAGAKYWSFSHSFFNPLDADSMHMMKSRGPSTDPSPTPSSVCWLQTQFRRWIAGGQVLILFQLILQSIKCILNAYDEEQGAKYQSFSNSFFSSLMTNSMHMMKSRLPSLDPYITPSFINACREELEVKTWNIEFCKTHPWSG